MLILRLFKQYILGWILLILYSIVAMLGTIVTLGRLNDTFGRQMIRSWGRTMLWCCGIKLEVDGLEHVRERQSRVILYNHESTLDIFIIAALLSPGGVLVGVGAGEGAGAGGHGGGALGSLPLAVLAVRHVSKQVKSCG